MEKTKLFHDDFFDKMWETLLKTMFLVCETISLTQVRREDTNHEIVPAKWRDSYAIIKDEDGLIWFIPNNEYGIMDEYGIMISCEEMIEIISRIFLKGKNKLITFTTIQDQWEYDSEDLSNLLIAFCKFAQKTISEQECDKACEDGEIQIKGITLLSVGEAAKFPVEIRNCGFYSHYWWWLRSSEYVDVPKCAPSVDHDGRIQNAALFVTCDKLAVRPALILDDSLKPKSGNTIEVFGKKWYCKNNLALLMDEPLTKMAFNTDRHKGNCYEESDIKKYLDNWLEKKLAEAKK